MADITYHEQEEQHNLDLIRNVCNDLPDYVKRFVRGVQQTTSPRTRLGYVRDIKIFFEYICEVYTEHPCDTPKDVSLDVLSSIDTFSSRTIWITSKNTKKTVVSTQTVSLRSNASSVP